MKRYSMLFFGSGHDWTLADAEASAQLPLNKAEKLVDDREGTKA
jgi:hypothetical protein